MRVSNAIHESGPWRIREIAPDFKLEDAWQIPVSGVASDFRELTEMVASFDPTQSQSFATRTLWQLRELLGTWFKIGTVSHTVAAPTLPIPGCRETSLALRLPADLQGSADDIHFRSLPFVPLYRTDTEFAAELSNLTVHAIMHLGWVPDGNGRFHGRMGVYVRPRGVFGTTYMALITPFRLTIVYPALLAQTRRIWNARAANCLIDVDAAT